MVDADKLQEFLDSIKVGTELSGFVTEDENKPPRECGNCRFFAPASPKGCRHIMVNADPEVSHVDEDDCCNYFTHTEEDDEDTFTLQYLILRHGCTVANDDAVYRGQQDYPLDDGGVDEAVNAARFLFKYNIGRIIHTPLSRSRDTAKIVNSIFNVPMEARKGFLPFDLGEFAGKSKVDYKDKLEYYLTNSTVPVPGGESLVDFQGRIYDEMDQLGTELADNNKLPLLVLHASDIMAIENYLADAPLGMKSPNELDVMPGGVLAVSTNDDGDYQVDVVFGITGDDTYQS